MHKQPTNALSMNLNFAWNNQASNRNVRGISSIINSINLIALLHFI